MDFCYILTVNWRCIFLFVYQIVHLHNHACGGTKPWCIEIVLTSKDRSQTFFSVYYAIRCRFISGYCPIQPGDANELRVTFSRVLKAGLESSPRDGSIAETGNTEQTIPASAIPQLEWDDPRAVDFRDSLRTWYAQKRCYVWNC